MAPFKNLVHNGVHLLCPKCSKTHLRASLIPKFFLGGDTPGPPLKRGGEERGRGGEGREGRRNCAVVNFP